ncbi:MAG: 4Fe-4S binding protein [bacterium]|nr:4Fe-4S binding protein [bacterium]
MKLRTIRRIWALFFIGLFFTLLALTSYGRLKGYEVDFLLNLSPLNALASFLTSNTLYQGMALSLLVVIPSLFFGRFFCSWVCPLGILNQFFGWLLNKKRKKDDLSANQYSPWFRFKYYLLFFLLVLAALGSLQTGLFDPISLMTRSFATAFLPGLGWSFLANPGLQQGSVITALVLLFILYANRFWPRWYCRRLCPLGAMLGLLSLFSPWAIRRDIEKCTDCNKCLNSCQGAADPHSYHRKTECHLCMNCIEDCPEGALSYASACKNQAQAQGWDVNRRRLVETGVLALAFFPMLRVSAKAFSSPQAKVIRPPGSLAEEDFLRRCIKCGECMKACPTGVLQPALLEAGTEGLFTPILVNKLGYCEHHCVLCGQVCPTGAIEEITVAQKLGDSTKQAPLKLGTAFFDRGRCLPWAMHRQCIVCEEVCPTSPKAIWFEEVKVKNHQNQNIQLKRPFVDAEKCIGCGICENQCPVIDHPAIRVTSVGESRSRKNQMLL